MAKILNVAILDRTLVVDSDGGFLLELFRAYGPSARNLRTGCVSAAGKSDFKNLQNYAHALKSTSLVLGLEEMTKLCSAIEEAAVAGRVDKDSVTRLEACLRSSIDELTELIRTRYGKVA